MSPYLVARCSVLLSILWVVLKSVGISRGFPGLAGCGGIDCDFNLHIIILNLSIIIRSGCYKRMPNRVKEIRENLLMSKAELARKAGVSPLTVDRVERGAACRMVTMRKIIFALGLDLADRSRVFPE